MNIPDILNKITDAILHSRPERSRRVDLLKLKDQTKILVLIVVVIAMVLILFGAVFGLIPNSRTLPKLV